MSAEADRSAALQIGAGLDRSLGLDFAAEREAARAAAQLGYTSLWTPEGAGLDAFHLCHLRWAASAEALAGGLATGISVSPVNLRGAVAMAMSAGTLGVITGGRFVAGIGVGRLYRSRERERAGYAGMDGVALMRAYLRAMRSLLAGETLGPERSPVAAEGARLAFDEPPRTPVYLGALGPRMLALAGEAADGAALNWCTAEQVQWSRAKVAEGEARAGREPGTTRLHEYIRLCVDEDDDAARRAFIRALLGYAGPPWRRSGNAVGYRAHFERMGFGEALAKLDALRARGASEEMLVDAFPPELALRVGYFGKPAGARSAFLALARGLDIAVVRVVCTQPGLEATLATLEACRG